MAEEIDTTNEWALSCAHNLPNHSMTKIGRGGFIAMRLSHVPLVFRTKQCAYRFAAWLITLAETLPDEDERQHTFEEILRAVRNV